MTAPAADLTTRYAAVPSELTACPQWVVWRREARDGKPTKVPYCAVAPRRHASSTDAATWAPFEVAADALGADPTLDGVGFVVTPALGVVGVDVDGCLTANGPDDTARAILEALPGTYCERSPSGRGLLLFVRGTLPPGGNRRGPVEMYAAGRFLTITGERFADAPSVVAADQAGLDAVHARFVAKPVPDQGAPALSLLPESASAPPAPPRLHDADGTVIDRAMAAANGGKVRRLWAGDLSDYDGDESRADAALLACLAYYTRDAEQLDRLSRASGLFRPKWDRPDGTFGTYGRRTITKALDLRPAEFVRGRVGAELRDEQGRE